MDDVERQAPHGDKDILEKKTKAATDWWIGCIAVTVAFAGAAVIAAGILVPVAYYHYRVDAHYYIAIDSVSDLSPVKGLSFNLTLGVASRSHGSKACIRPGTYAEVSYHGVKVAASEPEAGWLCAGPRKSAEQRVAARVTAVPVARVLDELTLDMKKGAAVFDINLYLPTGSYGLGGGPGGDGWVSGCKGSRVGAAAVWCNAPSIEPTL
jgi:hypothetical protein